MNGRLLADTNVLVELLSGNKRVADVLNEYNICISAITEIELLSNPRLNSSDLTIVRNLINKFYVFDYLTPEIKKLASELRRKKKVKKTPDAIIAATAITNNVSLFTLDSDFESIKELDMIVLG